MKKRLLIAVYLILVSSLFAGCSTEHFTAREYTAEGSLVQSINVDVRDRRIDVSVSNDDMVHIDYFESSKEGYDITLSSGVLTIEGISNKNWADFIGVKPSAENRRISIRIPAGILSSLDMNTTNENIAIRDIAVSDSMSLSSNRGNVEFENLAVGKSLSMKSKNGNIKGSVLGGYDDFIINCDIKKGDCNLQNKDGGEKILNVSCNNGDVNISLIPE